MRPENIDPQNISGLPEQRGWPRGSVSDDTTFLLSMTIVVASGEPTQQTLLEQLAADLRRARGAGRTSRAATGRFLALGALHADSGATNGAAMRALPIRTSMDNAPVLSEECVPSFSYLQTGGLGMIVTL